MSIVLYEVRDRVGYITLNRPEKKNALNSELVKELLNTFIKAENDGKVKVVILKANGDAFCAGADLAYLQQLQNNSFEENIEDSRRLKNLFLTIYSLKKVVIACVQGHALAGGCGLATICDFSFASNTAKFGYTEVKIGFIPALVSVFLLRKVGERKAQYLLLSGDIITAMEAHTAGIINDTFAGELLEEKVDEFAKHLIENNSEESMRLTKELINKVQSVSLTDALEIAINANANARSTDDCKKGIDAFLNKQTIKW
jgi:methylglutaconyl-CoA hydratase